MAAQVNKLIIAGGRDFNDDNAVALAIYNMVNAGHIDTDCELVCGMARGADAAGLRYFNKHGNTVHEFKPDWDGLGKRAGFVRNAEMGNFADGALIFWDGKSKGTKHMIDIMKKLNKPTWIVEY